jgi:hypothetical protein
MTTNQQSIDVRIGLVVKQLRGELGYVFGPIIGVGRVAERQVTVIIHHHQ